MTPSEAEMAAELAADEEAEIIAEIQAEEELWPEWYAPPRAPGCCEKTVLPAGRTRAGRRAVTIPSIDELVDAAAVAGREIDH